MVYTFNLLKKYPTLDINAVWSVLSSVTQQGSDQVVMTFKTAAVPYFYYIADQIGIVDQAVWSKVSNPVTYPDKNPVGTGAFTTGSSSCTPQNIKYTANPHYWQPGVPKVGTVNYPSFLTNDTANTYLANGQAQWGSQFIPSIQSFYLSKNPDYHYWFPPVANVSMFINLTNPLLKNLAVRQAMAYAIDRHKASTIGEYGYEPPSNQTGIVTPTFGSWLDTSQASRLRQQLRLQPGQGDLDPGEGGLQEGLERDLPSRRPASRCRSPSSTTAGSPTGWPRCRPSRPASRRSGSRSRRRTSPRPPTRATCTPASTSSPTARETGGPTPYFELRQLLYSANSAPIGTAAGSNFERYSNPATDALINQYGTTTDPATQHSIVDQLQKVMLADVPVIPVTESVDWFQYDTGSFTGWVTQGNPYAQPAAYNYPDWGQMMLHLAPK